ncbi:MAG: hypothetical protein IKL53_01735 [Lachnospiraceae bacterium]|nr:hypothetical protein [Lachnospiraceae bacterium]
MEIAIKSEADSRILVYPLIKALYNYGTIAVYSTNPYLRRLIENDLEGGFKNVRVIVSPEGDLEAVKESDEWVPNKYDFIIYDNIGAVDYDMLICVVTSRVSESYGQDLLFIAADDKTQILKFGSPAAGARPSKDSKPKKGEVVEEDKTYNKWDKTKTDEEMLVELLESKNAKWIKFPTYETIEMMESKHIMPTPDDTLIKELYRLFGKHLYVDERQFTKGARVKDESSSDISGTDVR